MLTKCWLDFQLLNTGIKTRLGPHEKVDLYKDYWKPQRKIVVAMHFFEISLKSRQKC